jgi:lipopolysaccharide export system permease protein
MRILDRYILKSILTIFFWCLFIFFFLFVIIDLFANLDVILQNKVGIEILKQYYLAYLPIVFVQLSPFACLIATLYTFAKLNHDNEIIAMRAAGLSIFQITKTAVVFGLIVSVFVFWVNDKIAPSALLLNEKVRQQMESGTAKVKIRETGPIKNLAIYGLRNSLFFVNKFYPGNNTMEGITILEHNTKQSITKKIVANKGIYKDGVWRFYKSRTYFFDENDQLVENPQYMEEEIMAITETPQDFLNQKQSADYMSISQIEEFIWKLSKSGATTAIRNLEVDLYQRLTSPFTSLIIILLGIPFALKIKKRATGLSSLGLSLVLGFLYYVLNAVSIALGKAEILIPFLSASLSHIAAILFSLYLIGSVP